MKELELVAAYRREMRGCIGDREKMSRLHSRMTESINNAYGTERAQLLGLRQELKDAMNCRVSDSW